MPHGRGSRGSRPEKGCSSEECPEGFHEQISAPMVTRQASQRPSSEGGGSSEPDGQSAVHPRNISRDIAVHPSNISIRGQSAVHPRKVFTNHERISVSIDGDRNVELSNANKSFADHRVTGDRVGERWSGHH